MAIYTPVVFESLFLQEKTRQNLHTCNVTESLQLVQRPRTNIKIFAAKDVIRLIEQAVVSGAIRNLTISEVLTFVETKHPRVHVYDAADVLSLTEFFGRLAVGEHLPLMETLTVALWHRIFDVLDFQESLTFKANRNIRVNEILVVKESLTAIVVDTKGTYTAITVPCVTTESPFTFGIIVQETPIGLVNGSNAIFSTTVAPAQIESLLLYKNGLLQSRSPIGDYTYSGTTITFNAGSIPLAGDVLLAYYVR